MNNEVYKEVYGHILNDAQRIRKEIMNEWGDILMFGGSMPESVVGELSTAARITGLAFDALSSHGVAFEPVVGKPDLFTLTVREERYVCHKTAIPSMSGFLDVVNIPGVSNTSESEVQTPSSTDSSYQRTEVPYKKEEIKEKVNNFAEQMEEEIEPPKKENSRPWDNVEDSFPNEEPDESQNTGVENFEENAKEEILTTVQEEISTEEPFTFEDSNSLNSADETEEMEAETDVMDVPDENVVEIINSEPDVSGFENNSDNLPNIGSFLKSDIFTDEMEKLEDEIVYEMFSVSMTHSGYSGGGKSLDAQIMIAPLKIQKFSCPSVPIIVSVYYKGKIITSSSYDQAEDGRNLVTVNVDEFYLLFRGSYDGNGKFRAFITTTGISASQGDILNITSEVRHGDEAGRNVRNGHVKFRSTIYDDPGTIEVFPFGEPEDNEFIVMTKTDEFVDYMYISNDSSGIKKPIMYQNGSKVQVNCAWDGDKMKVDLREV